MSAGTGGYSGGWTTIIGDRVLLIFIAFFVIALVGYPIVSSLRAFQLDQILALFTPTNMLAIRNTALATLLTLPPSLAIAVPLAWLCTRTNMPGRGIITALVGTSYVMPMLFTAIAYVFLFGRNAGLINVLFKDLLGGPLYDIYSFSGVVFVAVLQCFPLIFFTSASGFTKLNPELEESARIAGVRPLQVFLRITLGTTLPSIMAGVAFSFATALTMLSAPLILAVPIGIPFVTTEMYGAIVMNPNIGRAIALSLPLLIMTIFALWCQSRLLRGEAERFATISGKGIRADVVDLGGWRAPALILCLMVVSLSVIFPFFALLSVGLMNFWWKGFVLDNFTFNHFVALFQSTTTLRAISNSVILSTSTALFLAVIGSAMAFVLSGQQSMLKLAIRTLGMAPLGIAHVIAGVLVILAWYGWPFNLGGTLWLLGLGYTLVMMPYALKTCEAARGQIDVSLADAARTCGCTPLVTWRYVLFPLMRNALFTTFVIVFLFCIKEFPMTALIYSANTTTLAVRVYNYFEGGSAAECGAAAVVLLVITFGVLILASRTFNISMTGMRV